MDVGGIAVRKLNNEKMLITPPEMIKFSSASLGVETKRGKHYLVLSEKSLL